VGVQRVHLPPTKPIASKTGNEGSSSPRPGTSPSGSCPRTSSKTSVAFPGKGPQRKRDRRKKLLERVRAHTGAEAELVAQTAGDFPNKWLINAAEKNGHLLWYWTLNRRGLRQGHHLISNAVTEPNHRLNRKLLRIN
jgi:hypothetical protein